MAMHGWPWRIERDGPVLSKAAMDFFDDGPEKPVRIWSRIGRRPIRATTGRLAVLHHFSLGSIDGKRQHIGRTRLAHVAVVELGHLPFRKATYEDYVGQRGLERLGKKKWRRAVAETIPGFELAPISELS